MQDIHTHGGVGGGGEGGGRVFAAGGVGGVERRLRPHTHQNHQPLKCPRCDSLNTKFCYYNNYNLSQPRHFCKGCRRYWTKGGVLRNVPVGGGCRKSKRSSKPKAAAGGAASSCTAATDSTIHEQNSNSHSSSESSSLTATTTAATKASTTAGAGTTPEVASTSATPSSSNFGDSRFFLTPNGANTSFDHNPPLIEQHRASSDDQIFSFTNMMTPSNEQGLLGFFEHAPVGESQNQVPNQQWQNEQEKTMGPASNKMVSTGCLDHHQEGGVQVDLTALDQQNRCSSSGLDVLDWGNGGSGNDNSGGAGGDGGAAAADQGLFDFTGAIDQAYWSQTQWVSDPDHQSLNFLP